MIGVGTHQHCPWLDLPGTAADAEAVAYMLQDEMVCGYPAPQVRLLTHGGATRAGILAARDDLAARTGAGDDQDGPDLGLLDDSNFVIGNIRE